MSRSLPAVITWPFQTMRWMRWAATMMSCSGGQKVPAWDSRPCSSAGGRASVLALPDWSKATSSGIITWPSQPVGPG